MQKLQERVAKAETLSSEALQATQAESARATQAEAARQVQTAAVVDSLLAFKQTQAAELAKRDAAIAELHTLVGVLQGQFEQHGLASRQQAEANGQSHKAERQQEAANGQSLACVIQQEPAGDQPQLVNVVTGSQKAALGAAKGRSQGAQRAAIVPSKGKERPSLDGTGLSHAPKIGVKAKAGTSCSARASAQRGTSSHLNRNPLAELPANEVDFVFKADSQVAIVNRT